MNVRTIAGQSRQGYKRTKQSYITLVRKNKEVRHLTYFQISPKIKSVCTWVFVVREFNRLRSFRVKSLLWANLNEWKPWATYCVTSAHPLCLGLILLWWMAIWRRGYDVSWSFVCFGVCVIVCACACVCVCACVCASVGSRCIWTLDVCHKQGLAQRSPSALIVFSYSHP